MTRRLRCRISGFDRFLISQANALPTNRTVRPELVEGQSRIVPNEEGVYAGSGTSCSVRPDKALHFDKLSANGSSTEFGTRSTNNKFPGNFPIANRSDLLLMYQINKTEKTP